MKNWTFPLSTVSISALIFQWHLKNGMWEEEWWGSFPTNSFIHLSYQPVFIEYPSVSVILSMRIPNIDFYHSDLVSQLFREIKDLRADSYLNYDLISFI